MRIVTEMFQHLFPKSLKTQEICNYITQHGIRKITDQTWYVLYYLGHNSKGKELFDRARNRVSNHLRYFIPSRDDSIQLMLSEDDSFEVINPIDYHYSINVQYIINMIPELFRTESKNFMTIAEIKDAYSRQESFVQSVGYGKKKYDWTKFIIPKAVEFFTELKWGTSDRTKQNLLKSVVLYNELEDADM